KAIAEAKALRPGGPEIAEIEKDFAAGPLRETAKSGDGPTHELVYTRDRSRIVVAGSGYESVMIWDAETLKGSPRGGRAGERDKRCFSPVPVAGNRIAALYGVPSTSEDSFEIALIDASSGTRK